MAALFACRLKHLMAAAIRAHLWDERRDAVVDSGSLAACTASIVRRSIQRKSSQHYPSLLIHLIPVVLVAVTVAAFYYWRSSYNALLLTDGRPDS